LVLPPEAVVTQARGTQPMVAALPPQGVAANRESAPQVAAVASRVESGPIIPPSPQAVARGGVPVATPVAQSPTPVSGQAAAPQAPMAVTQAPAGTTVALAAARAVASSQDGTVLPRPIAVAAAAPVTPSAGPASSGAVPASVAARSAPLPAAGEPIEVVAARAGPAPVLQQAEEVPAQVAVAAQSPAPGPAAPQVPAGPMLRMANNVAPVAVAPPPEAEASSPLLVAQAATRPPATIADLPRTAVSQAPVTSSPAAAAPAPATPQAALAQMVPEALARQDSIGPLLNSLAAVVQKAVALPEPVLRAALGVLAQRIVTTDAKVVAADLERAVAKSGVYLEASLAKALPTTGDAKSGLLALRDALGKWLGEAPVAPAVREAPPPLKGLPLRAPAAGLPPLPDAARDVARTLHGQADAAVSRTKLMQMASLPDADVARPINTPVRMELPFLIGHELVMAQIQIAREGSRREAERKRGWTMRFALNFSATGEVGAEVGLLGKAVNVALWAVEPETAEAMQAALPELGAALEALGLDPGAVRIRQGAPEPEKPVSGRLVDSVS
jgi:hypothetical protein